ncbi:MAG TPA: DUF4870 domain-containing protein [Nonomuraea sp.]|nr:DUF4870 domain-containing protein [Nonomuraea sp.]
MTNEVQPVPGWYVDPVGLLRWWDGLAWGPVAPAPAGQPDSLTWGLLAHLGFVVMWFVGPLLVRETVGRSDAFVRKHATESLNANLTLFFYWNIGPLLGWILGEVTGDSRWHALFAGMPVALLWIVTTAIRGAVTANKGEAYRYPAIVRIVPGGWPRAGRR